MIDKKELLKILFENYPAIQGVEEKEIDEFIESKEIVLCQEHKDFFRDYGNSKNLLISTFANCTYDRFKKFNLNADKYLDHDLPKNMIYFGQDFSDESLCIDNNTGNIYVYDSEEVDLLYYQNIDSFLIFAILFHEINIKLFNRYQRGIKIDNLENYILENEKNKIHGLSTYYYDYYLKENTLIALNYRASYMDVYMDGALVNI